MHTLHGLLALCGLLLILAGCAPTPYETTPAALGLPEDTSPTLQYGTFTIRGAGHTFAFTPDARPAAIDGVRYHLNHAAGPYDIYGPDAALLRAAVSDPAPVLPRPVILLDPGHGGKDIGCSHGEHRECDITADIAQHTADILRAAGCEVRLTRTAAQGPTLQERVDQALLAPPDAYVSIHVNSAANPEARGMEVYTLPLPGCDGTAADAKAWTTPLVGQAHIPQATRLALGVQRALLRLPGDPADRGVRHAHFKVLRDTPAPSILIETGFITNPEDRARLTSPEGRRHIGFAIALGILSAYTR